jgi:hypothetical protein
LKLFVDPNIQTGGSTIQNLHIPPSRQTKQILPSLFHEETTDDRRKEKKRLNDINKWQENSQKEQVRIKGTLLYVIQINLIFIFS